MNGLRWATVVVCVLSGFACNLEDDRATDGDSPDAVAPSDARDTTEEVGGCPDGERRCGGLCVDNATDLDHCGACGVRCDQQVEASACEEPMCARGSCTLKPVAEGEACALSEGAGTGMCVRGGCVECVSDGDCARPPTSHPECFSATCGAGARCVYVVPDPQAVCGAPTCEAGVFREADLCGEQGSCNLRDPGTSCEPYRCAGDGSACRASCSGVEDCVEGAICTGGECIGRLVVDLRIDADRQSFSLSDVLVTEYGWNEAAPVDVSLTIAPGVSVGAVDSTKPALSIGSLPENSDLRLVNRGAILGAGGAGGRVLGRAGTYDLVAGANGGDALVVAQQPASVEVQVENAGVIGGGGGGGASGYFSLFTSGATALGGGGGAGVRAGAGGSVASGFSRRVEGEMGSRERGGAGGVSQLAQAGAGGDLGLPGRVATAQSVGSPGAAGRAVVGDAWIQWIELGDVRGARQ